MSALELFGVLRVRQDVFIVEQNCPYPDIDDIDTDPSTIQHWISDDSGVVSTMRTYVDAAGRPHVGRVSTSPAARGRGHSARLMHAAIARLAADYPDASIHIEAQSYLKQWYEGFGYRVCGDEFIEDGIPHLPMVRRAEHTGE